MLLLQLRNNLTYDPELSPSLVKWNERIDCCGWQGVNCNGAGQVIGLDLTHEWFSGSINPLANLKFLSVIRLDENNLSAPFSRVLRGLLQSNCLESKILLRVLYLNFLQMDLYNVCFLAIQNSQEVYPSPLGTLGCYQMFHFGAAILQVQYRLVSVYFAHNSFNGSIPSFRLSKTLTYANFRRNLLTGEIISSNWYGLENLETLDFSDNSISGLIPPSFFSLPSLTDLRPNDNKFYGQIKELQNVTSPLTNLDLSGNNLAGPLPDFFFQLHNLSRLSLSFNNFSGTVKLCKFTKLKQLANLDLSHNRLSVDADISESDIALLPQLFVLRLASCNLRTVSFLKNNQFGFLRSVKQPYRRFGFLNSLDLHANLLTGEVPLPPPTALYVDLSRNKFYGFISADFSNHLSNAWFFSVAHNKISGTIPSSISNATNLEVLDLSSNSLNGSIPACLANKA
ncbi:hypothetical protein RND71_000867 [Anisodus tanguticus]|uniref:Leucine-rich repeat-containing N-terminal plant-type domain-containing protein n=1 Tax=Anisodus tanguticus TaxID=243964 RepID=A0AAE1SZ71_9SOLA|nr:hypothetical protein RND71_000867 [Anisodus tanguticus]